MPSRSAARHTSNGSPTGSAAASCSSRRVSAGSALQPPLEGVLEHPRAGRTEARRQFRVAHAARQLQQGQRVATGLGDDPLADVLVEPAGDDRGEQGARILVIEPLQAQLRHARQLALLARLADGEDDRDPLGEQAARHEPERLRGGLVEPLEVVHETQQRLRLGRLGQQRQRRQADEEAVGSRAGRRGRTRRVARPVAAAGARRGRRAAVRRADAARRTAVPSPTRPRRSG